MVQKYQSPVRVYKYPFELVMAAYVRRFPTCHLIPVFVGCDIIHEEISADCSQHIIERRCKLNVDAPYLLKKIIGVDYVYFVQRNTLNRRKRCLQIEAYNESFASRVAILETCTYFVHPDNPEWTCFQQAADLDIKSFFGFENAVEKLAIKQYSQNIARGKEIIEYFINELARDGITELPVWREPSALDSTMATTSSDVDMERYVGKLTAIQESKLVQLRKCIVGLQKTKIPSDPTLVRFLKANHFDLEKTRENVCASLQWRKKHQVDRILDDYSPPDVVKTYFPGGWHHQDKESRPLYVLRLGQMDVKGLIKSIGEEGLLQLTLQVCEKGLQLLEEATRNEGVPVSTWSLLLDLEGLNMRHLWRPGIKALLRVIEIVEANYPETMGRVFIVRAPRVFPILWTLVSPFIDDMTRSKFLFYGGNDYQESGGLMQHIAEEILPDFLEGTCKTCVVDGGLVPKSMYLCEADTDWEKPLKEDSIYQCVTLGKGQIHEVLIEIKEAGSVITWDFDILKHDVCFRVLCTTHTMESCSSSTQGGDSISQQSWHEGQNVTFVEPQLICHDGESVQGSHVAGIAGSYVLQWRYHSTPHSIADTPNAHIMYYTECLSSTNYRGSLSSLQSGQSCHTIGSSCASR